MSWPARMQRLTRGPLVEALPRTEGPEGWELWVDGGHNPAAGAALQQMFSGPMMRYSVRGSWDDPQIEPLRDEPDPAGG